MEKDNNILKNCNRVPELSFEVTKSITFLPDAFSLRRTHPLVAGSVCDYGIGFSGIIEIANFEWYCDYPDVELLQASIEVMPSDTYDEKVEVYKKIYPKIGTLMVLENAFNDKNDVKCDGLALRVIIPTSLYREITEILLRLVGGNSIPLLIFLDVMGLDLDWNRKGHLPITSLSLCWKGGVINE